MDSLERKKLAVLRILQILEQYSDYDHPMTQEDISNILERDYGISIDRKTISRNISLLKEALEHDNLPPIVSERNRGAYLESRDFTDAELQMLIDSVLSSTHITAKYTADLIEKLCGLSNIYFKSHVKNIYSVNDWNKTDNRNVFYNIELIDEAIESNKKIAFDYNKYGADKKLHKSSSQILSPYQLIIHNQHYFLMSYNEKWEQVAYYRLDRMTNMTVTDTASIPLRSIKGYENGIDYKKFSSALPYMYSDKIEDVEFIADNSITDQVVDWFGATCRITKRDDKTVTVSLKASPNAMEHWAMQYVDYVEVTKPEKLREKIKQSLCKAQEKYK